MQSRPGNPYDGHTLAGQIEQVEQVERITGVAVARAYVDRGYRGHGVEAEGRKIFISRQKCGITPTIRRELRRRAAIESVIGHNLRLFRRWLISLLCVVFTWLSPERPSPDLRLRNRHIA